MDLLASINIFLRVAETGSFSAVAREVGMTQPAVSRQVARLEVHLGARLVQRTTRSMSLTEEGRDFAVAARQVQQAVEQAEASVGTRHRGITGMVRLGAPPIFARILLAPRLHRLLDRHPGLSIDLVRDDGASDLVQQGVDVTIRVGELAGEANWVARRIGAFRRVIVGAASYLDRRPPPSHPSGLAAHDCILDDRSPRRDVWSLRGPGGVVEVPVTGRFRTDSPEAGREAVATGLGLAVLANWIVRSGLNDGSMRTLLTEWAPPPVPVHLIYPSRANLPPRTRTVIDFLLHEIRTDPEFAEVWTS